MSPYELKYFLLQPRTAWRRSRSRIDDPFLRTALEVHHFGSSLVGFIEATRAKPDLLTGFPLRPASVVVDVGAYDGTWAEAVLVGADARLVAFEPDPTALPKLHRRLDGCDDVEIHEFGLAGGDATATLSLEGPGSTTHASGPGTFGAAEVTLRDVVGALDELGLGIGGTEVELLKLNIEGGEYDVLDRLLDAGWLPNCRFLLVQFHEWHPRAGRRRRRIRSRLRATHREVWNHRFVWELWERRD